MNDKIIKQIDKALLDEQARKDDQEAIVFSRLPNWKQANEIGDRLADGSDEQSYEVEYPEDSDGQSL